MASAAERIAKALADCAVLTEAVRRQGEIQSNDHDEIIRLGRDVKTLFHRDQSFVETSVYNLLRDRVAKLEHSQEQKGVRQWQIWMAILTSVVAPIVVILLMKHMGLMAGGPP